MEKETLLIVGNGFDLGLGFKTSYHDFMASSDFPNPEISNLAHYLVSVRKGNLGWIDIEHELSTYSRKLSAFKKQGIQETYREYTADFRKEYDELKGALRTYLNKAVCQKLSLKRDNHAKCILDALGANDRIVTFNYTDTIERLSYGCYSTKKHNLLHIHGSLKAGDNIVFGVEDTAELPKEHVFLYKAYSSSKRTYKFSQWLREADKIIFYGYSLGDTDKQYFAKFFQEQCKGTSYETELVFYYYNRDAYDCLKWQLQQFTNHNLSRLEMYNHVEFRNCANISKLYSK